jgi:hypothetical protein
MEISKPIIQRVSQYTPLSDNDTLVYDKVDER